MGISTVRWPTSTVLSSRMSANCRISVRTRSSRSALSINATKAGPCSFLLDTGTQITMVDPSLAAELHLATEGQAKVASVDAQASASFARLDRLEAGSHAAAHQKG